MNNPIEIIAHRGASSDAPENTITAIISAWNKNTDAVEIDVHLSKDNRIVAIHDRLIERVGNKSLKISNTHSNILRKLDISGIKGTEFTEERIPFLEEVLATLPEGKRLFIDVKCGTEIIPPISKILKDYNKISQIVVIGFDLNTMSKLKKAIPEVKVYWILKRRRLFSYKKNIISKALSRGLDGLDGHFSGIKSNFVKAAKSAGLDFIVWTVDDIDNVKKLLTWGIDGITTNRPIWLREQLYAGLEQKQS